MTQTQSLIAAGVAGITGSLCCVGPLILLTLGLGGAWASNLTALEPYRPIFSGAVLLFLGLAFRRLYLVPQTCEMGKPCAKPSTQRRQRLIFWLVSIFLLSLLLLPLVMPYLFD